MDVSFKDALTMLCAFLSVFFQIVFVCVACLFVLSSPPSLQALKILQLSH